MAGGGPGDVLVCVVVMIDVGNVVVAASLWIYGDRSSALCVWTFGFGEAGKEGRGGFPKNFRNIVIRARLQYCMSSNCNGIGHFRILDYRNFMSPE